MTDYLITPSLELIEQWANTAQHQVGHLAYTKSIARQAAQWGADRELEACCNWLPRMSPWSGEDLRKHRRLKPLSLKAQALALLDKAEDPRWDIEDFSIVRKALEALADD